jgi:hypothetical protein
MGDHAEDRFLEHVLGLAQRLIPAGAAGRAVPNIREGYRETILRLGFEEGGVNVRHLTSHLVVPAKAGTQGGCSEHGR